MAAIGEIIRCVLSYSHPAGSIMQNVFTWEVQDEAVSDIQILDAIDVWIDDEWVVFWEAFANDDVLLFLNEVDVLNGDGTVLRNIGEELQAHYGVNASEVLPAANSGFIQAVTERAKSLGRKYVPGAPETAVLDGYFTAANLGYLVGMAAAWVTGIDVGTTGLLAPGVLSVVTELFLEFTGSTYATDVPAYQRRRKPNVGS
ncbi:MAG: hypothetical protein KAJ55_10830 [Anaerolineales bacterium]|nr:hypothetical protein [Anaerolineales bacterium]